MDGEDKINGNVVGDMVFGCLIDHVDVGEEGSWLCLMS